MSVAALVADLCSRGFSLCVVAGSLRVSPKSALTPVDYEAIRVDLPAVIAVLSAGETWDRAEANRLMSAADVLVERLGVDGRHPAVAAAVAMVGSAYATRDLETVRLACSEFAVVVRGVRARARRENEVTQVDDPGADRDN